MSGVALFLRYRSLKFEKLGASSVSVDNTANNVEKKSQLEFLIFFNYSTRNTSWVFFMCRFAFAQNKIKLFLTYYENYYYKNYDNGRGLVGKYRDVTQ